MWGSIVKEDRVYDLSGEYELLMDEIPCSVDVPPVDYPLSMQLPGTTAQQKLGTYNESRESGFFTEKYPFAGQIWLRRVITLSREQAGKKHCFLTLERTRVTEVWINGEKIGSENSLCTPHVYDLSRHLAERRTGAFAHRKIRGHQIHPGLLLHGFLELSYV